MAAILNTFQDQASAVWLTSGFNRVKIPWIDAENTIHLDIERFFRIVTLFGGIECIGVEFWHEIATQTGVEQEHHFKMFVNYSNSCQISRFK